MYTPSLSVHLVYKGDKTVTERDTRCSNILNGLTKVQNGQNSFGSSTVRSKNNIYTPALSDLAHGKVIEGDQMVTPSDKTFLNGLTKV